MNLWKLRRKLGVSKKSYEDNFGGTTGREKIDGTLWNKLARLIAEI